LYYSIPLSKLLSHNLKNKSILML